MNTLTPTEYLTTDVLIVGAGPTGLALAITLRQHGVEHLIVEKLPTGQNTSRAAVLHAHTLETLEPLGVTQGFLAEGLKLARFTIRDRDKVLTRLKFDTLPTRFASLLMLTQDRTEKIMLEALTKAGGTVRWGSEVTALRETDSGVEATLSTGEGTRGIRSRFIVGADGMHSIVRQTAGIGFTGGSFEESFILADVDMSWQHGREEVMLFFSPAGMVVVAPLPGGRFRVVATLDDAPPHPSVEDIQALLDARGPTRGPATVSQVHWSTRFRLHHRVADNYRRGRILLVGDAAHVHSPAGGQGMNTGLVDAWVLGRLLADVITGSKSESHLDHYERLRRPAAEKVLELSGRLTTMATMRSAPRRLLRNFALRTISALPFARRKLEMNLSGISRRESAVLPNGNGRA